ncbi:MAG TPA: SRPBCC domain-containing protein [Allosphingosinicella sp.]|nr:SRPBCC domain-containing protein [Allosphingosinicella sp.]
MRVSRTIAAPPERVFDAWLAPATVGQWLFATPGGEMSRVEIDARIGGAWSIVERRDGEEVLHTGTYEEIDRPRRLVFTLAVPKYSPDAARVAVDIVATEAGCEVTLTQSAPKDAPVSNAQIEEGWSAILAALAGKVEKEGGEDGLPG